MRGSQRRDQGRDMTRRQLFRLAAVGGALTAAEPIVRNRGYGLAWAQTPRAGGTLKMLR
jgi:hypothetical protein